MSGCPGLWVAAESPISPPAAPSPPKSPLVVGFTCSPTRAVPLLRGSPSAAEPKAGFCRHLAMEKRWHVAMGRPGNAASRRTQDPAARLGLGIVALLGPGNPKPPPAPPATPAADRQPRPPGGWQGESLGGCSKQGLDGHSSSQCWRGMLCTSRCRGRMLGPSRCYRRMLC